MHVAHDSVPAWIDPSPSANARRCPGVIEQAGGVAAVAILAERRRPALTLGTWRGHPDPHRLASADQSQAARAELNKLVISSITDWRELITRAWWTGVFGNLAKQWAPLLLPT